MENNIHNHNTISTTTLKIWAIVTMACDHFAYMSEAWEAGYYAWPWALFHAVGRIAAPIFFYLLALGYRRTRDANGYTARLLVFALITYVPYVWYFYYGPPNAQNFFELNVMFTLLFGLLLLRAVHEVKNPALKALAIAFCLICGYFCDYGLYGLAMILVCDVARGSRRGTMVGMGAVIMTYVYMRVARLFPSDSSPLDCLRVLSENTAVQNTVIVMLCQLIPLALIAFHRAWVPGAAEPRPGFLAKWGFYVFYPAHITVFLALRMVVF